MAQRPPRWVVGTHSCQEVLATNPQQIKEICFQNIDEAKKAPWESLLSKTRVKAVAKPFNFFKTLSEFGHQGVAIATTFEPEAGNDGIKLYLDGLEDPHNLGAIIRTSWLMGVDSIHITERNSVKLTPTVCKVASGGCEHIAVVESNFVPEFKRLKDQGYWIYGFSDKATKSLYDIDFEKKSILVFGSEEKGVRIPVLNECDEILSIPQVAQGPSYNVSVAVGISLAEVMRQVRLKEPKD